MDDIDVAELHQHDANPGVLDDSIQQHSSSPQTPSSAPSSTGSNSAVSPHAHVHQHNHPVQQQHVHQHLHQHDMTAMHQHQQHMAAFQHQQQHQHMVGQHPHQHGQQPQQFHHHHQAHVQQQQRYPQYPAAGADGNAAGLHSPQLQGQGWPPAHQHQHQHHGGGHVVHHPQAQAHPHGAHQHHQHPMHLTYSPQQLQQQQLQQQQQAHMLAHQQQQQQQQHAQQQQQAAAAAAASASDGSGADDDDDDDDDGDKKGGKRKRQMKSPEQLAILEKEFSISPLPNKETRTRISNLIGLTARQVQIWFQNKRAKVKNAQRKRNPNFSFQGAQAQGGQPAGGVPTQAQAMAVPPHALQQQAGDKSSPKRRKIEEGEEVHSPQFPQQQGHYPQHVHQHGQQLVPQHQHQHHPHQHQHQHPHQLAHVHPQLAQQHPQHLQHMHSPPLAHTHAHMHPHPQLAPQYYAAQGMQYLPPHAQLNVQQQQQAALHHHHHHHHQHQIQQQHQQAMVQQQQPPADQMTLEKPKEEGASNDSTMEAPQAQEPNVPTTGEANDEVKAEDGEEGDEEAEEGEEGEGEGEEVEGDNEDEDNGNEGEVEEATENDSSSNNNGASITSEAVSTSADGKAKEAKPDDGVASTASLDEVRFRVKTVCKKAKKVADNQTEDDQWENEFEDIGQELIKEVGLLREKLAPHLVTESVEGESSETCLDLLTAFTESLAREWPVEVESTKAEEARQAVGREINRLWRDSFDQLQPVMPDKVSTRWAQTASTLNVNNPAFDLNQA